MTNDAFSNITSFNTVCQIIISVVAFLVIYKTAVLCFFFLNRKTALDRYSLEKAGFTHILNAAHGQRNVDTGPEYYQDMTVEYHGVEADDLPTFNLSQFFYSASKFIDNALQDERSKEGAENG